MSSGDRHVIKGRGKHRGQYLCYARLAPEQKATEDGFVWLSDQRNAARWDDPRYCGRTWSTDRARLHNGYFVRLVPPKAITARVPELKAYIYSHAAGADETLTCHWFDGDVHDAGENFCWDCAKRIAEDHYDKDPDGFEKLYGKCLDEDDRYDAAIRGGDIDHDSPPHCQTCGRKLSGHLTNYGADEEISALTSDCAPAFNDVNGWAELECAIINLRDDDPRWKRIAKTVDAARAAEQKASLDAAATPATGRP